MARTIGAKNKPKPTVPESELKKAQDKIDLLKIENGRISDREEQTFDELQKAKEKIKSLIYQRAHLLAFINIITKHQGD